VPAYSLVYRTQSNRKINGKRNKSKTYN